MVMDIQALQSFKRTLQNRKAQAELLNRKIETYKQKVQTMEKRLEDAKKARIVIQKIAQEVMQSLEFHISKVVTTALESVFPNAPEFLVRIEQRRNKTECDLLFKEFEVEEKPEDSSGGGPLDVTSFSLRVSFWSLRKNRPTLILDEPFKFVSPRLQHKVSEMLKMISEKLKIQIIMVSHADEINYSADRTFKIGKKGKYSLVEDWGPKPKLIRRKG